MKTGVLLGGPNWESVRQKLGIFEKEISKQQGFMKAIVDCNNFYCSCERLFKPHLKAIPVVVLSNNDGCIISRSDEAKKLGIKMAQAYFLSKPLLQQHGITAFSSNYNLYGDMSKRVMETMQSMFPSTCIEVYSVDEAFVDMSHVPAKELHNTVKELKERIGQWTGIPVSIGVAPTKTLAKIANRLAKENKEKSRCMLILDTPGKVDAALRRTPIGEIWGVGKQYAIKLEKLEVKTAFELKQMPEEWARQQLGGVVGVRLIKELKGIHAIGLDEQLSTKKMVSCTRRFGRPLTDLTQMKEAVAMYVSRAAEKLRRQQSAAGQMTVFVIEKALDKGDVYKPNEPIKREVILPVATCVTTELIKPAVALLEKLYREGVVYEKAGVVFGKLVPDASLQGNFFAASSSTEHKFLMSKVDNINFSMRNELVKVASSGVDRPWKMKQELLSKRYTTRWVELREVN
ncbi:Y-family DNA polymerase [Segetibacter aerophilus]|uniref:SOS mutagenesis and repair protein UmuC n=1 Tax=Segetibacter aerophilus TaxID=670293 RepID=A0A512BI07_9BACT|nr:Y-family DNA polymerase [Segetibacter aerophilus]GEO11598.1 SOS mutagenesis and repair protein UmuC [Segetibacter aerophilus]